MFTGIVTDIGTITKLEQRGDLRATITVRAIIWIASIWALPFPVPESA